MYITRIGYHYIHYANFSINRPEGSGDYLFLLLKSPAQFMLNGQKQTAESGTFILYKKGTPQIYQATDSQFINDWIHLEFSQQELAELKQLDIPFNKLIHLTETSDLSDLIRSLCYTYFSNSPHRTESLDLYLRLIFIKLSEKLHYKADPHYGNHYENIMLLRSDIYNRPYEKWTIDSMAHHVGTSRSYFQHIYKEIVGLSAIDDLIQSRIQYAKHLLTSSGSSVISISEQCGYTCLQHFIRQFKKNTGQTPKEFRESHKSV